MSRPYHRGEINKAFEKVKAELHAQAIKEGNGRAFYIDSYTGQELWGGDAYDYDHIYLTSNQKDEKYIIELDEISLDL